MSSIDVQLEQYNSNIYTFAASYLQTIATTGTGVLAVTVVLSDPTRHPAGLRLLHASWVVYVISICLCIMSQAAYIFANADQIRLIQQGRFVATNWQAVVFAFCIGAGVFFLIATILMMMFALHS